MVMDNDDRWWWMMLRDIDGDDGWRWLCMMMKVYDDVEWDDVGWW